MNKLIKYGLIVALLAVVAATILFLNEDMSKPVFLKNVLGVDVYSRPDMNISEFQVNAKIVGLHEMEGKAETTCNLGIAALSRGDRKGYDIQLERKPLGIVLDRNFAYIRGETDEELLTACHAFICLRENLSCAKEINNVQELISRRGEMVIVLDNKSGSEAIRAYAEILGVMGFMQAHLADTNKDTILSAEEINNSRYHIYPYIMDGDLCVLQPLQNALQTTVITNNSVACDQIMSGVFIKPSRKNSIEVDGNRIVISADEEHVFAAAVIVRDIISPDWIRFYYQKY